MLISIIIPTYKPDSTLFYCLESISKQTFNKNDFEVILVLNGIKEPYYHKINNFLQTLNIKIVLLYTEQTGVSNARNIGINKSHGKYVTFIDSDDFVSENYLENLYNLSVNNNCLALANVLCYDDGIIKKDYLGIRFEKMDKERFYSHLKVRSYFSVPIAKLLPYEVVKEHSFCTNLQKGEDGVFMFEIEPYLNKCQKTTADTIYYRRLTKDSLSRKRIGFKKNCLINMKILKEYISIYFTNLFKYNFVFFSTRIIATLRNLILG